MLVLLQGIMALPTPPNPILDCFAQSLEHVTCNGIQKDKVCYPTLQLINRGAGYYVDCLGKRKVELVDAEAINQIYIATAKQVTCAPKDKPDPSYKCGKVDLAEVWTKLQRDVSNKIRS
jgi:hypothetical protein